jgi:GTP-binding protein
LIRLSKKFPLPNLYDDICALMEIKSTVYTGSYGKLENCPTDGKPEFAFIGRSNVGKSSLINMLCGRKELARVSQKPGKTQSINFYTINDDWHLVDLPGYGYARTSKTNRSAFGEMLRTYLTKSSKLVTAFVLIDSNIPPQRLDIEFITFLGKNAVPFSIVFTKADRIKPNELAKNTAAFKREMFKMFDESPNYFVSSAERSTGRDDILQFVDDMK